MPEALKHVTDLKLPDEFLGLPVHLMVEESNPPTKPPTVARVGYHQDATDTAVWFDIDSGKDDDKKATLAQAQAALNGQVAEDAREYLKDAPFPAELPVPQPAVKPLTQAQVQSQLHAAAVARAAEEAKVAAANEKAEAATAAAVAKAQKAESAKGK